MMELVTLVTILTVSDISLVTSYQLASDQFRTVEHARQPVITSQARSLRAPLSDEVTLPCTVEHLGKLVVVWKHGEEVITAGAMMVSPDPRYSLGSGYNLRVENLRGRDEGAYTCSVSTLSGPVTVTHNLEILGENLECTQDIASYVTFLIDPLSPIVICVSLPMTGEHA